MQRLVNFASEGVKEYYKSNFEYAILKLSQTNNCQTTTTDKIFEKNFIFHVK